MTKRQQPVAKKFDPKAWRTRLNVLGGPDFLPEGRPEQPPLPDVEFDTLRARPVRQRRVRGQVVQGTGNVFADLGRPNSDTHLIKAELVSLLRGVIEHAGWSQAKAAEVLGIAQPDVSRILRGLFANYSVERLIRFLSAAGCEIDITVRAPGEPAQTIHLAPAPVAA